MSGIPWAQAGSSGYRWSYHTMRHSHVATAAGPMPVTHDAERRWSTRPARMLHRLHSPSSPTTLTTHPLPHPPHLPHTLYPSAKSCAPALCSHASPSVAPTARDLPSATVRLQWICTVRQQLPAYVRWCAERTSSAGRGTLTCSRRRRQLQAGALHQKVGTVAHGAFIMPRVIAAACESRSACAPSSYR